MPTYQDIKQTSDSAELRFRNAFHRLKNNEPVVVPIGTPVSQNNVAKEASCDPSALKKSRFPLLVLEIQCWIEENKPLKTHSARQKLLSQRKANRDAKSRILEISMQRDKAQSQLNDAYQLIIDLTNEVATLRATLEEIRPSARVFTPLSGKF